MQTPLKKFNRDSLYDILYRLELHAITADIEFKVDEVVILNALISKNKYKQALHFLALGLPRREAVWWAYITAKSVDGEASNPQVHHTLAEIEQWVKTQEQQHQLNAKKLADNHANYTPTTWAAMATFWARDTLPATNNCDTSPIPTTPFMCGEAVFNCLSLALERAQLGSEEQAKLSLKQGLHIAMGGNGQIV